MTGISKNKSVPKNSPARKTGSAVKSDKETAKAALETAAGIKEKACDRKEGKKRAEKQARDKARLTKKASDKARKAARKKTGKQGKDKSKIVYQSSMQRLEAVNYFDALTVGLKKGSVQFKQGDNTIIVTPPETVDVEIHASKKGRKETVTFELSWVSEKTSDLLISSK